MSVPAQKPRAFTMHLHESQAQSYEELLAEDSRSVPSYVRDFGEEVSGPYEVPTRWYTDPDMHRLETEKIWKRKWQFACRTDHVASKGDTFVYNIAGLSFVIVRVNESEIKAYWNSCLHRGVPLRQCAGRVDRLQCPFHGFTWSLDGKSVLIPHPQDFPHIDPENFSLPEAKVAVWQDFVFINPDPNAEPFENYLSGLDEQFARWPFTGREVSVHVSKVFAANWKTLQEAFMESFHVVTTHPQLAAHISDRNNQFRQSGNVSRGIMPQGQTNEYVPYTPDEDYIFRRLNGVWDDEEVSDDFHLPEGTTARAAHAERLRMKARSTWGARAEEASDSELVDVFYYTLFPNFHPFGPITPPAIYKFAPYGNDPNKSVMEVMFLLPVPEGAERKPPPPVLWLGEEEEFADLEQLGTFGPFLSQDSSNMAGIMAGLRNSQTGTVNFARVQEAKIRHFYSVYEKTVGLSAADEIANMAKDR